MKKSMTVTVHYTDETDAYTNQYGEQQTTITATLTAGTEKQDVTSRFSNPKFIGKNIQAIFDLGITEETK